jgi:IS30 family transposase
LVSHFTFECALLSVAQPMRLSKTYHQRRVVAMHKKLTHQAGMAVWFCDPHSPWQRGSNENTNGTVRQYLPKDTDFSLYGQEQFNAIADEINDRYRKGQAIGCGL